MENNKKVIIGLSALALAGVVFYFWKKNKDENNALKNIQQKLNADTNIKPLNTMVATTTPIVNSEVKSSFDGEFSSYKCSCTGKEIDRNSDEETLGNFKKSCLKSGGMLIDVKAK
jgi:hypothetical protein